MAFARLSAGRGIATRIITKVGSDPAGVSVLDGPSFVFNDFPVFWGFTHKMMEND